METNTLLTVEVDSSKTPDGLPRGKSLSEAEAYLQSSFIDAYDSNVAQLARDSMFKDGVVPMSMCTGPAIRVARVSVLTGWTAFLVMSIAAFLTSKCDASGFVYYPFHLWFCFIPLIALKLYWQHLCLKYTTIPFVQATGEFTFCRCVNLEFSAWFAFTCILLICQSADYGSDSFFIAVVLRAGQCGQDKVNEIWHEVMSQSTLAMFANLDFTTVAIISYALMFCQPLVALLQSTPSCSEQNTIEYNVGKESKPFRNCLGIEKNMGDALYDLADASDMCSIQIQSPKFPMCRAKHVWEDPEASAKVPRVLSFIHNALNRTLVRIGLVTLLENTYQINLQVSIMAIFFFVIENGPEADKQLHPLANLQIQTQLSIALSAVAAFLKFGEVIQILSFSIWTVRQLHTETDARLEIAWVLSKVVLVIMISLLIAVSTTYAVVKYYHVMWVCEDRLWNLSGCVDMSHFKTHS